jgi:HEAT repeat protein
VCWLACALLACGQDNRTRPELPQASIPKAADADVRHNIGLLYAEQGLARGNAATRLASAGSRATPAVPYLKSLLEDGTKIGGVIKANPFFETEDRVGFRAAAALAAIEGPGHDALLQAVQNGTSYAKRAAVYGLGEARVSAAAPLLMQLLGSDEPPFVRENVPQALERIGDHAAVEPLMAAFVRDETAQSVWPAAGAALASLKDVRAIAVLVETLAHSKHLTRRHLTAQILRGLDKWPGVSLEQRQQVVQALTLVSHESGEIGVEAQKSLDVLLGDAS